MSAVLEREYVPGYHRSDRPLFALPPETQQRDVPPENDRVAMGEELFDRGKKYRDQRLGMRPRWSSYLAWYLNNGTSPYSGESSTTYANLIFEKCESVWADMTDSDPAFLFEAYSRADVPLVNLLNDAVPFVWEAQDCTTKYLSTVKGEAIYGTWYWAIEHDPRFAKTGSVVRIREVPPWYLFPAPYAVDIETAPWIIEARPRPVGEIFLDYGVNVEPELIPQEDEVEVATALGRTGITAGNPIIPPSTADPTVPAAGPVPTIPATYLGSGEKGGMAIQKILYIRDATQAAEWGWHDTGGVVPELKKTATLKYPYGRVISWANGKLLYDRPMPYADGEFPYVTFRDCTVPDFWYGIGEIHGIINLQLLHDDTLEMMKLMHLYMAMGRLIIDKSTGLEDGMLGNMPGEIWWTREGTADRVKWLPGLAPPGEFYTHAAAIERWVDLISGKFDVTRGVNPTGVTAARALITLQNAANTRVRARLRQNERSLVRAGKLIASRIRQFWPSSTTLRVTGQQPTPDFARFRDYHLTPEDRDATFNLKVNATANLEAVKKGEFQKMLLLHSMGLAGPQHVVESADMLNEQELLAELPQLMLARSAEQEVVKAKQQGMNQTIAAQRSVARGSNPPNQ